MPDEYQNEAGVEEKSEHGSCPEEERRKNMLPVENLEGRLFHGERFNLLPIKSEVFAVDYGREVVYVGELKHLHFPKLFGHERYDIISGRIFLTKYEKEKGVRKKTKFNFSRFRFETEEVPYVKNKKIWSVHCGGRTILGDDYDETIVSGLQGKYPVFYEVQEKIRDLALKKDIILKPKLLELVFKPIMGQFRYKLKEFQDFMQGGIH
jgi:hypothetical protein